MSVLEGQELLVEVSVSVEPLVARLLVGVEKTFRAYDPEQVLLMVSRVTKSGRTVILGS